jgi:hypothetical protein
LARVVKGARPSAQRALGRSPHLARRGPVSRYGVRVGFELASGSTPARASWSKCSALARTPLVHPSSRGAERRSGPAPVGARQRLSLLSAGRTPPAGTRAASLRPRHHQSAGVRGSAPPKAVAEPVVGLLVLVLDPPQALRRHQEALALNPLLELAQQEIERLGRSEPNPLDQRLQVPERGHHRGAARGRRPERLSAAQPMLQKATPRRPSDLMGGPPRHPSSRGRACPSPGDAGASGPW